MSDSQLTPTISSSSDEYQDPQPLHEYIVKETNEKNKNHDNINNNSSRSSISSKNRRTSIISNLINRDHEENYQEFTESNIYGDDIDQNSIQLKRTRTRQTIIDTLQERADQEEVNLTNKSINNIGNNKGFNDDDLENNIERTKSFYDENREEELPTKDDGLEFQKIDPELVTWESEADPENPRNWSSSRKWKSTAVVTLYTLLSPFASTMLSPAVKAIDIDFGNQNTVLSALMVSIYVLAWALFPTVVAPCSELFGRKYVLDIGVWILLAFNFGCAFAKNLTQMLVFRFFAGVGGTSSLIIGAGVLADLFDNDERGKAMALYSIGPTFGPCISALIAGYIVQYASWRWCFWVLCMLNAVIAIYGSFFLEETYAPTLLKQKAKKLRKLTGNENLHTIYDIATGETIFDKFYTNFTRPISLLFTHPMVFGLGIFMAITYGCLYILVTAFPTVWSKIYGFSAGGSGLMYLSFLIGYMVGIATFQRYSDKYYNYLIKKNNGIRKPEYRLPGLLLSGILTPIGLFWFGWAAEKRQQYVFVATGAAIFGFSMIGVFYCVQGYLIEMNPRFSASSIAAASIFRSFMGFGFPLFAPSMFDKIGYGWSFSIFGFIALATGIPFSLYLYLNGESLRNWANQRMSLQQAKRDAKNLRRLQAKQGLISEQEENKDESS
ncbi:hypothetical protein WICMUC_000772 [Wickerhamomyces mucosus]|uniref:Major facilitator superfamily (MFS) profile domain-containing protein n=1 Tax=Wickerhamomyces mucosus TaxID=1378264 RepID=A0A9P8PYN6_9ASCO|nr:hypothetical protein WICMUC_000772 [Wickerhamomyces mucosus]